MVQDLLVNASPPLDDCENRRAGVRRELAPRTHYPGQFGFEHRDGCHD